MRGSKTWLASLFVALLCGAATLRAAAAEDAAQKYGLPALRELTSFVSAPAGRKSIAVTGTDGTPLPGGGVLFGLQPLYGGKAVPYVAPYKLGIHLPNGEKLRLALPDFAAQKWVVADKRLKHDTSIEVGLEPNAADRNGVFWCAVVSDGDAVPLEPGSFSLNMQFPAPPEGDQPVDYQFMLPAADGTSLATNVYLPYKENNPIMPDPPYPAVLMRTPYNKDWIDPSYITWTSRFNAVVVTQYFRGRPDMSGEWPCSGGEACLFTDHAGPDHSDAVDTVRWLRERHWCNGKVLATGPSGLGLWIYQAAPILGEELAGIYPIVCAGDVGAWAAQQNGCYKQGNVETWLNSYRFPPEMLRQAREWASDPDYWRQMDFNALASGVDCPGLHETTWWDVSVEEGIKSWQAIDTRGAKLARGRQWLIVGPWRHDSPRTSETGELQFPGSGVAREGGPEPLGVLNGLLQSGMAAAQVALNGKPEGMYGFGHDPTVIPLQWDSVLWIASVLGRNPLYRPPQNKVLAYFIGEEGNISEPSNTWVELATWPPPNTKQTLYLNAPDTLMGKQLKTLDAAALGYWQGGLSTDSPAQALELPYICDPQRPLPTLGGANIPLGEMLNGPYDQRPVLRAAAGFAEAGTEAAQLPQALVLNGEPLAQPLSIAGAVEIELFVSTEAADTDVVVKLVDIYPEDFKLPLGWPGEDSAAAAGRQLLVCDSAMRLSWWCERQGLGKVQPGRVYKLSFTLGERAYVFGRGHRIGLQIQGSNYPRWAVNPGTGQRFMENGRALVQHNSLHLGGQTAAKLTLPVWKP